MRCLVVGDVHLKPWILDKADKMLEKGMADVAVCLGDLVDDFGEEYNIALYRRTMERAIKFQKDHPNTVWIMGNHDYGYWHPEYGRRESGHSKIAEIDMHELLMKFYKSGAGKPRIAAQIGRCIFSHAGVNASWIERHHEKRLDAEILVEEVGGEALWEEDSPIWWRPQTEYGGDPDEAWGKDEYLQVVGHSPVKTATQEGSILSCDTFSTYRNGAPYGDQSFVVVDTVTKEWRKVE